MINNSSKAGNILNNNLSNNATGGSPPSPTPGDVKSTSLFKKVSNRSCSSLRKFARHLFPKTSFHSLHGCLSGCTYVSTLYAVCSAGTDTYHVINCCKEPENIFLSTSSNCAFHNPGCTLFSQSVLYQLLRVIVDKQESESVHVVTFKVM